MSLSENPNPYPFRKPVTICAHKQMCWFETPPSFRCMDCKGQIREKDMWKYEADHNPSVEPALNGGTVIVYRKVRGDHAE